MTRRRNEDETGVEEATILPDDSPQEPPVEVSVSEFSEAEEIVVEASVAPIELVVASDNPLTDDIVNKDAKPQKAVRSHITIVYVGAADTFSYGPYKFRPGQPAKMPSVIAEELLTYPFEKFEVKE